jgi:hypothetical protein
VPRALASDYFCDTNGRELALCGWRFTDIVEMESNATANHFFQSDAGRFVFCLIDVDAWPRTTLQLFAAFRGENN